MLTFKNAAYAVGIAGLLWLGWIANGWRIEASRAEALDHLLKAEMQRRVAADAQRVTVTRQLQEAREKREVVTREVIKRVLVRVPDNVECDIPDEPASMLQRARSGVFSTGGGVAPVTKDTGAPPPDAAP